VAEAGFEPARRLAASTLKTYRTGFRRFLRWLATEGRDVEGVLVALGGEPVYVCQLVEEGGAV
jgi:hypothetical protein